MTRGELLDRMDSRELTEWQCFDLIEPSGERQANRRAALIVATILNLFRDPKEQPDPIDIDDILPMIEPQFEDEDDEEEFDPDAFYERAFAIFGRIGAANAAPE